MERRVAVVTGGASGIGQAVVRRFVDRDVTVVVADRDLAGASVLAKELNHEGARVEAAELDLGEPAAIQGFWTDLEAQHGRCDILINSAGVSMLRPLPELELDEWQLTLGVNVTGPLLMAQSASRLMARQQWGRIVNVSSVSGYRAGHSRTAYGTSKAAMNGLTRQLAIELAQHHITVNAVAPGPVSTPLADARHSSTTRESYHRLVPMKRYGTPAEVAFAIDFLCQEEASYITGHTIPVDGGFLAAGVLDV